MPTQSALQYDYGPSTHAFRAADPNALLRALVDCFSKQRGRFEQQLEKHQAEEILLDLELDGERYLLVRLPSISQTPVQLSPREQEIVRMVAQGNPNKVIAAVLNISSWTVCTHLRRVFAKLGVTSRAAMVARYLDGSGANRMIPGSPKPVSPELHVPALSPRSRQL